MHALFANVIRFCKIARSFAYTAKNLAKYSVWLSRYASPKALDMMARASQLLFRQAIVDLAIPHGGEPLLPFCGLPAFPIDPDIVSLA